MEDFTECDSSRKKVTPRRDSPDGVSGITGYLVLCNLGARPSGGYATEIGTTNANTTFYVDGRDADLDQVSLGTQGDHKTDSNNYDADARLSALSLNGITLDQTFHNALKQYTASVANSVSSTTVTATKRRDGATVAITPADAESGTTGHQVNLGVGTTVISVTVTASNNTTTKTYTITIERAAS